MVRRRNLPHLAVPGATYFITFRAHVELPPAARDVVIASICACNQMSIDLEAAVVMPDHAHLILRVIEPYELSQILQPIKGGPARAINRILKRRGSVWSDESFDHIIRQGAELEERIEYIRHNPVQGGLVNRLADYKWLLIKSITG